MHIQTRTVLKALLRSGHGEYSRCFSSRSQTKETSALESSALGQEQELCSTHAGLATVPGTNSVRSETIA